MLLSSHLFHLSHQSPSKAIEDNATSIFHARLKADAGKAVLNARFEAKSPKTVYGHTYAFFVMDKTQSACKHNLAHLAACVIHKQATTMFAMTAMPVTTKPQVTTI